jgi:hypothetical protein
MMYGAEDEGQYESGYEGQEGGNEMYQDGQEAHGAVEDPYYNEYDVDQVEHH